MGILEKTRALLVSKLGSRIKDLSADERALKDLILELERCRGEITAGLASLAREVEYIENHDSGAGREADIEKIQAEVAEGEVELARVEGGIDEVRSELAALSKRSRSSGRQ